MGDRRKITTEAEAKAEATDVESNTRRTEEYLIRPPVLF